MKRIFLIASISFALISSLFAQESQIPNSDFENWNQNFYNSFFPDLYYWEMLPIDIWASGNEAAEIVGEFPTSRTEDAHSGNYAARLETLEVFGQMAAGNLFTGQFIPDMFNSKALLGIPFTDKPSHFTGWYKYTPANYKNRYSEKAIDECSIYALLSKWNGNQRDTIALAKLETSETISQYTQFNLEFIYQSDEIPDSISVVFASSARGEEFIGGVGSVLYIDDIELIYEEESVIGYQDITGINIKQNNNKTELVITYPGEFSVRIFDITGKEQKACKGINELNISTNSDKSGIYIIQISTKNGNIKTERYYVH